MNNDRSFILRIAPPYDENLIRLIEHRFSDKFGSDVQFDVIEDPTLLCGFIAYARGTVYDMSGKTQMAGIQEYLMDSIIVPLPVEGEGDS